jgi:hypothetical protein
VGSKLDHHYHNIRLLQLLSGYSISVSLKGREPNCNTTSVVGMIIVICPKSFLKYMRVFWVMTLCSVAVGYRHFGGLCYLHFQGLRAREHEHLCVSSKLLKESHSQIYRSQFQSLALELFFGMTSFPSFCKS